MFFRGSKLIPDTCVVVFFRLGIFQVKIPSLFLSVCRLADAELPEKLRGLLLIVLFLRRFTNNLVLKNNYHEKDFPSVDSGTIPNDRLQR